MSSLASLELLVQPFQSTADSFLQVLTPRPLFQVFVSSTLHSGCMFPIRFSSRIPSILQKCCQNRTTGSALLFNNKTSKNTEPADVSSTIQWCSKSRRRLRKTLNSLRLEELLLHPNQRCMGGRDLQLPQKFLKKSVRKALGGLAAPKREHRPCSSSPHSKARSFQSPNKGARKRLSFYKPPSPPNQHTNCTPINPCAQVIMPTDHGSPARQRQCVKLLAMVGKSRSPAASLVAGLLPSS